MSAPSSKASFSLLIALFAGLGCGEAATRPREAASAPLTPLIVTDRPPARYELADPGCQTEATNVKIGEARLGVWNGARVEESVYRFRSAESAASLVNAVVKLTSYDDRYVRDCDYSKGEGRYCQDRFGQELSWTAKGAARPLRVCHGDASFTYPRLSYERIALSALRGIETAAAAYQIADGGAHPLQTIQLTVLPQFVDLYHNYVRDGQPSTLKTWLTHNMAYFESPQMIAVFPEPEDLQPTLPGFFWESPFVLAHEFGHHVEATRQTPAAAALGLAWSPLHHSYLSVDGEVNATSQVLGSFSEAFADLLAFYATGGDASSLVGLPCFGRNRDPGSRRFANGDDKILTEDRLSKLLGESDAGEHACGEPNYGDIHYGGAIVASLLDATFAILTGHAATDDAAGGDASDDSAGGSAPAAAYLTRYRLALAWDDAMTTRARNLRASTPARDVLALLPLALEDAADTYLRGAALTETQGADRRRAVCVAVRDRAPALARLPFGC